MGGVDGSGGLNGGGGRRRRRGFGAGGKGTGGVGGMGTIWFWGVRCVMNGIGGESGEVNDLEGRLEWGGEG